MSPIGAPSLIEWPLLSAEILFFGATFFTLLITPANRAERYQLQAAFAPLWRALSAAIILLSPLGLLMAAAEMADVPWWKAFPLLAEVMGQTHVGRTWAWRLGCALLLTVATWLPAAGVVRHIAVFTLSGALLLLESLSSHAIDHGAPAIAVCCVHEIAAAVWLGALFGLWFGFERTNLGHRWVERAARRVSRAAGYAVGLLVLTGCGNAYNAIGLNPARLVDAAYGRTLLMKLGLFAVVLGIGGYNRFRLMPAVEVAPTRRRLLRNLALESVLLLGVLGLTALLANTPPPHGMRRPGLHPMMEM